MKTNHLYTSLHAMFAARQNCFVWGPAGVGKSQLINKVADDMFGSLPGKHYIDLRAVTLDPVDVRGIPDRVDGRLRWLPPAILPTLGDIEAGIFASEGVICLEELNTATPMVMNALLELTLDRRIGDYTLPDGWRIAAAGNRSEDGANVQRVPAPLLARFNHITLDVDLEQWDNWAAHNDINPMVRAFIKFRSELLHSFSKDKVAWPNPRSWVRVAELLPHIQHDDNIMLDIISGQVGEGAAAEFIGFLDMHSKLPKISDILQRPDIAPLPKDSDGALDPATSYVLLGKLSTIAKPDNIPAIATYVSRFTAEFQVIFWRDAKKATPELVETAQFVKFSVDNGNVFLD